MWLKDSNWEGDINLSLTIICYYFVVTKEFPITTVLPQIKRCGLSPVLLFSLNYYCGWRRSCEQVTVSKGHNLFIHRSRYGTCRYNPDSRDNNLCDKRILVITNLEI